MHRRGQQLETKFSSTAFLAARGAWLVEKPRGYFRHFALLSEAIFLLLLQELSSDHIDRAGRLLTSFTWCGQVPIVQEHFRFSILGTIFHSESYKAGKKNSSVFESKTGGFYSIKKIFEVTDPTCALNGGTVLLCTRIVAGNNVAGLPPHISDCFFSLVYSLLPLSMNDIGKACVLVSLNDKEEYICAVPNMVERD
ncbi:hypothetical protein MRX96_000780 [Rhipicephalus microplus]